MTKTLMAVALGSLMSAFSGLVVANDFPTLETAGAAELKVAPDTAVVEVEVVSKAASPKDAKALSDKAVAGFMNSLEAAGVAREQISSANLMLNPEYRYEQNAEPQLLGFVATRQVSVRLYELDKVNAILDAALNDGINRVGNIQFMLRDDKAARAKVRELAIKDARSKAESVAEGFGTEIEGVWNIRYFEQQPLRPVMFKAEAMAVNSDAAQSYQSGDITLTDQVSVTYRLKQ